MSLKSINEIDHQSRVCKNLHHVRGMSGFQIFGGIIGMCLLDFEVAGVRMGLKQPQNRPEIKNNNNKGTRSNKVFKVQMDKPKPKFEKNLDPNLNILYSV